MSTQLMSEGVQCGVGWNYQDVLNIGNSIQQNSFSFAPTQFTNGTGQNNADRLIVNTANIAVGGSLTLNFSSFTDNYGYAGRSMARVKLIYIELTNVTNNANSVQVGNAANPLGHWITPSTGTVRIRKGNPLFLTCLSDVTGYEVAANTACELKISNDDATNVAQIKYCIMGASA